MVLANSAGIERLSRAMGAERTRVVRLGADLPTALGPPSRVPTIVSVGHLVARKRHADVLRAMWLLRGRLPALRYLVIGDGPERGALETLARDLGLAEQVEFAGQLPHFEALARMRHAHVFVLPSTDEAFGVAYIEAMAGGMPAIGALGEPGPAEITGAGDGMVLVPPGDPEVLAGTIEDLLADPRRLAALGALARATVERAFSWRACGQATIAAYEDALR
jgi:glycosyltransferase involved in cell wall biosynthesis